MSSKFHIGDTVNYYPSEDDFDADHAIEEYLVKGFVPADPPLTRDSRIVTIGPCFAHAVGAHLLNRGYAVTSRTDQTSYIGRFGDKIGNTFAIRGQLEWAWLDAAPETDLWHGYAAERLPPDEEVRARTRHLLDEADAFILTLGNAEIWQDAPTGGVFWGAVPNDQFDAARHRFRVSTYQENLSNLMEIYRLIRRNRPDAAIVTSLGATPPPATFRSVACLAASTSSKSMLRSALDEFFRVVGPRDSNFHYFPSYDIARYAIPRAMTPDFRRLRPPVANFLTVLFEHYFAAPVAS
ncbi:MAG: GSCFA domain-containing protein, partial [Pseudomonadota bacterium]|nr:GSCFA domain-containing protein [Pseudomonadota bacterium]